MQEKAFKYSFRASDGNTVRLEYHESLPSAVALAKQYANSGYSDRYVVLSEKQTALSALGTALSDNDSESGLYLSLILRPSIFPSQAGAVGPLSAVALATALEEHTAKKMSIGWVSDIYCEGVKIGGVSVEGKLDSHTSYEYLIVSFAIKLDQKNFPPRLTDMVRRVFESDNTSVAMIMAKTVLNKFFGIYRELKNPAKLINHYVQRSALTNKKIKYIEDGKKKRVRVIGINKDNLSLTVETKDGRQIDVTSASSVIIPNRL
ncbi:MAG: hypothetical protein IJX97_01255 [Clostridia bacterium]|nr:hypothetical protein [Clostridia bacterium]